MYDELKSYLIGKLMWNAYMSEEEYDRHINEFLQAYYGKGWKHIRRYIDLEYETTAHRCFTCKESVDLCFAHFDTSPKMPTFKRFFRRSYIAKPYQPMLPDHPLSGLCDKMEEVKQCFDDALAMAETDTQRAHIEKSRFSLTYLDLFCTEHDEFKMTAEERAAYEGECDRFYENKKRYQACYNIHTVFRGN